MSSLPKPPAELFEYFRDLGFEELWPVAAVTAVTSAPVSGPEDVLPVGGRLEPAARATLLTELGERAATCRACGLAGGRRTVVFGSGNPDAELMFIGEGPGAEEDRQGLPFVGPAGELLTKIIAAIELARSDVYIANVVKCRPPGNRDPLPDEVAACRGFLRQQIRLVEPRVIVALGRVAAQTLLGRQGSLASFRGVWHEVEGVPCRVTYHPAALLRDAGYKRPTWEDLKLVRQRLGEAQAGP